MLPPATQVIDAVLNAVTPAPAPAPPKEVPLPSVQQGMAAPDTTDPTAHTSQEESLQRIRNHTSGSGTDRVVAPPAPRTKGQRNAPGTGKGSAGAKKESGKEKQDAKKNPEGVEANPPVADANDAAYILAGLAAKFPSCQVIEGQPTLEFLAGKFAALQDAGMSASVAKYELYVEPFVCMRVLVRLEHCTYPSLYVLYIASPAFPVFVKLCTQ